MRPIDPQAEFMRQLDRGEVLVAGGGPIDLLVGLGITPSAWLVADTRPIRLSCLDPESQVRMDVRSNQFQVQ